MIQYGAQVYGPRCRQMVYEKSMLLWNKLWYYGKGGTVQKTMEQFTKEKHGRLPKTMKLWLTMEKTKEIYQNNWSFEKIYSFRTSIYYGKNYSTLENNYGTIVNYI